MKNLFLILSFSFSILSTGIMHAQIADLYPNDMGIETDPKVLFVEKFDDGMTAILSRYNDVKNAAGMSLDADVPPGSLGPFSIKMTSITGGVNDGGHLYKKFTPGFDSTVFVRYYVKYPVISNGYFHHEGMWFGGYNPATPWPNPQAGTCGLGNSRLSIAVEPVWQNTNPPGMDTYMYWGDIKSWNGGGSCYGNAIMTQGATDYGLPPVAGAYPTVAFDQWMCVEVMVKLNNPVNAYNGELKIWVNGIPYGHWGPGFPNGHWFKDKWYNNPADLPFPGFRWRTDPNLNINYIWIEFYHDDVNAPSSYIKYDHVVMAKEYIGPIKTTTDVASIPDADSLIRISPNPSKGPVNVKCNGASFDLVEVFDIFGKRVCSQKGTLHTESNMDLSELSPGIYFIRVSGGKFFYSGKIIMQ